MPLPLFYRSNLLLKLYRWKRSYAPRCSQLPWARITSECSLFLFML